jgi:hypothetical protein
MRSGQGGQPSRARQMGDFGYSALTPEVSLKYGPAAPFAAPSVCYIAY